MPTTRTQLWQSPKFAIERIEDEEHGALIFRFTGAFAANEMYAVLKPLVVVNIFDFDPRPGKELPVSTSSTSLTFPPWIPPASV